jgi:hypothetical protein
LRFQQFVGELIDPFEAGRQISQFVVRRGHNGR